MTLACIKVSVLATTKFPVVDKNDTIEYVYKQMKDYGIDRSVVKDKTDRLIGIVTKKDIIRKLAQRRTLKVDIGRLHVSSFMTSGPITITEDRNYIEAAKLMTEKNIGSLPVLSLKGDIVGLLTRKEIAAVGTSIKGIKAKDVMTSVPFILKAEDKIINARQQLLSSDSLALPVVKDERLIGYISINEVADALFNIQYIVNDRFRGKRLTNTLVSEFMRYNILSTRSDEEIGPVIQRILDSNGLISIVSEDNKIVGMVTLKEIVTLISSMSCI